MNKREFLKVLVSAPLIAMPVASETGASSSEDEDVRLLRDFSKLQSEQFDGVTGNKVLNSLVTRVLASPDNVVAMLALACIVKDGLSKSNENIRKELVSAPWINVHTKYGNLLRKWKEDE